jgi:PIN domain nuclease of toxin-antitoxin system
VKLLLDTHLLLWAAGQPERLSSKALKLLENEQNDLLFSAASLWEMTIQCSLGRSDFSVNPRLLRRSLLDNGYQELSVRSEHAVATADLPFIHRDPFDRIFIAQAIVEGFVFLTIDSLLEQYGGPVRLV